MSRLNAITCGRFLVVSPVPPIDSWFNRLWTSRIALADDVDFEEFLTVEDDLSGAYIKVVYMEVSLSALRERQLRATKSDVFVTQEKIGSLRLSSVLCS